MTLRASALTVSGANFATLHAVGQNRVRNGAGVFLLLCASLSFSFSVRAAELIDRILVRVNSRVITQSMFNARLAQTVRETPEANIPDQQAELRQAVIDELVNEALLEDRARDLDLFTTEAEIEDQINKLKQENRVHNDEEFARALAATGLTVDKLKDQLRKSMTVQRVVGREVHSKVDLSDDALRAAYERDKEQWRIPEQVRISEILIPFLATPASQSQGEKKAKEAIDRIKGGIKFDVAVNLYSDGPTRDRGGDLGWLSRGELIAELDKVAFSLPVGEFSDPVLSKNGWHIIKVTEKKPLSYKPFTDVRADILKKEQETQFQRRLTEYLEKLRKEAVIKVVNDVVKPAPTQVKSS